MSSAAFFFFTFLLSLCLSSALFFSSGFSSTGWISSFTLLGLFIVLVLEFKFKFWLFEFGSVVCFFYGDFSGFLGVCWLLFEGLIIFDDFNYYFFGVICLLSLVLLWFSAFFSSETGLLALIGAVWSEVDAPQPIMYL